MHPTRSVGLPSGPVVAGSARPRCAPGGRTAGAGAAPAVGACDRGGRSDRFRTSPRRDRLLIASAYLDQTARTVDLGRDDGSPTRRA
jgi:hypothetical protein